MFIFHLWIDSFVFDFQLVQEKFDFFPLNRALSLSVMDEGSTDSKVDDLLRYVTMLVERQREEVRRWRHTVNR